MFIVFNQGVKQVMLTREQFVYVQQVKRCYVKVYCNTNVLWFVYRSSCCCRVMSNNDLTCRIELSFLAVALNCILLVKGRSLCWRLVQWNRRNSTWL